MKSAVLVQQEQVLVDGVCRKKPTFHRAYVSHFKLPMVLKVPRLNSSPLALCDRPFSLLGFGDILVPGISCLACKEFYLLHCHISLFLLYFCFKWEVWFDFYKADKFVRISFMFFFSALFAFSIRNNMHMVQFTCSDVKKCREISRVDLANNFVV